MPDPGAGLAPPAARGGTGGPARAVSLVGPRVAARVAWERPEWAGLILESTFPSLEEMARVAPNPSSPPSSGERLDGQFDTLALVPGSPGDPPSW